VIRQALFALALLGAVAPATAQEEPATPVPAVEPASSPTAPATPEPAPATEAAPEAAPPASATEAASTAEPSATEPVPAEPATTGPAGQPAAPRPERITFELQFPAERGGGSATGSAGALEYPREDFVVASGAVEIKYQDLVLRAETVELDLATKQVVALGEVRIDQGPQRLAGERATFDLETKTGNVEKARAQVGSDYFFRGEEIAKTGEDTYRVRKGFFTSCVGDDPAWSFGVGEGRVQVDGYARAKHVTMRLSKVPVLYFPYILWPVKPDRTSGFLIPNIGYSKRRGAYLGLAYYQVLGRSADDTLYLDLYSREYLGFGNELRYQPSEGTKGNFKLYAVHVPDDDELQLADPEADNLRWKMFWDHRSDDLFPGVRSVVAYRDYSDFEFFQDFERDFDINTARFLYSNAYLSGNWGPHSVNVLVDSRETFVRAGQSLVQRQLPEIEYRLRSTKLGRTPLYLEMRSSVNYLDVERSETYQGSYGRADLSPQLTLPLRAFPWLSVSLSGGGRATWWGERLDSTGQAFTGESITRTYPVASASIVGPSVSRIFDGQLGSFGKFKHVIEPRFEYDYLGEFEEAREVPVFDEVDTFTSLNTGRVALVNRLLAKPSDPKAGGAREVLSLEISQIYSFDKDVPGQSSNDPNPAERLTDPWGPVISNLRFAPSSALNAQWRVTYSTLFSRVDSNSLSATWRAGQNNLGLTWFQRWDPETGETRADQIRVFGGLPLLGKKLRVNAQLAYDIDTSFLQQQRYMFDYTGSCWSARLEYREFKATNRLDRDWRFAITLKNVGTFLDLTGGDSTGNSF
jgi:LPS-assembly protein